MVKGQEVVDSIAQDDLINEINIIRKGKEARQFDAPEIFKNYFDNNILTHKKIQGLLLADFDKQKLLIKGPNSWNLAESEDYTSLSDEINKLFVPINNYNNIIGFIGDFKNTYNEEPTHLSLISYDLIGLVYYLASQNDFLIDKKVFLKKNKFKGMIGTFKINKNKITHILNFYETTDNEFKKIF